MLVGESNTTKADLRKGIRKENSSQTVCNIFILRNFHKAHCLAVSSLLEVGKPAVPYLFLSFFSFSESFLATFIFSSSIKVWLLLLFIFFDD